MHRDAQEGPLLAALAAGDRSAAERLVEREAEHVDGSGILFGGRRGLLRESRCGGEEEEKKRDESVDGHLPNDSTRVRCLIDP